MPMYSSMSVPLCVTNSASSVHFIAFALIPKSHIDYCVSAVA